MLNRIVPLAVLLCLAPLFAQEHCAEGHDESHRFIFFAVLEGCYLEGLSNEDVDQILMKNKATVYEHFIYACPICTPAIHGFEAYRSRPEQFSRMKSSCSNFGDGLKDEIRKKLYSKLAEERLIAINELMSSWISKRMRQTGMNDSDLAHLKADLEKKRKRGMEQLTATKDWELHYASFKTLHGECPACNAAVGLKMTIGAKE